MSETQDWKQSVAREFIEKNILNWLWEITDSLASLKEELDIFGWDEKKENDNNNLLKWSVDRIMNILFNENWKLRNKIWFEFNKIKNLSYYMISEDWKNNLDLLYTEIEKSKSESELRESLAQELQKLQSEVAMWASTDTTERQYSLDDEVDDRDNTTFSETKNQDIDNYSQEISENCKVDKAIQRAIDTANNQNLWYHWWSKWNWSYDCSWFVTTAFKNAWFDVPISGTTTMQENFKKAWFEWIPYKDIKNNKISLRRWDILLKWHGVDWQRHTEIYLWNWEFVWAHGSKGRKKKDQISVTKSDYYMNKYPREWVLRYPS